MSQQQTLHNFFKIKSKSPNNTGLHTKILPPVTPIVAMERNKKKRSLSLRRTPSKSPKTDNNAHLEGTLNNEENCSINTSQESCSSSDKTILYSLTPTTPQKSPAPSFRSPSSNRFYSPNKKRSVVRRSSTPKKNLFQKFNTAATDDNEEFLKACEGMDDKTIFLLNIINRYLTTESLRPLLDEQDQMLLESCFKVPKPGMRLVCRLYWRQRDWYIRSALPISDKKSEAISDSVLTEILVAFVKMGLLVKSDTSGNTIMTFSELTEILKLEDLKKICKDLLKKTISNKENIIKHLQEFTKTTNNMNKFLGRQTDNKTRLLKIMSQQAGECYKLADNFREVLNKLYLLMYLGINYNIIRERKLELLLIQDKIGAEVYPIEKSAEIDNASVVFHTKDDFYKYANAHKIYEDFLKTNETVDKCKIVRQVHSMYKEIGKEELHSFEVLPPWLQRYTPGFIYIKILDKGVQDLKRLKSEEGYKLALEILETCIEQHTFRQHSKAEWYNTKALILQTIKQYDQAASTLIEGFNSNLNEELKTFLRPRAEKLATQKNIVVSEHLKQQLLTFADKHQMLEKNIKADHVNKQPLERISASNRGKVTFGVKENGEFIALTAEQYCIKYYTDITKQFTHGEHWEGRIVTSIFFLLFWDIIYSQPPNVRGIYLSHYQTIPLDLNTCSFYTNRKKMIDDLLDVIEKATEEELVDRLYEQWAKRPENELSGYQPVEWPTLRAVASCLRGPGAAALCRNLAHNYMYWRSGFPDLTLWDVAARQIKFVEVKTDTDKPSLKQIQWMHYLNQNGLNAEFCYIGTNTTRCKTRAKSSATSSQNTHDITQEILNSTFDSDSDFEDTSFMNYKDKLNKSGENQESDKISMTSDKRSSTGSNDDVIIIPEEYVQIIIDG